MGATLAHQVSALESRGKAAMKAISLLYHDVVMPGHFDSSGFTGGDADIYKFARPEFERHLEAIAQAPQRKPHRRTHRSRHVCRGNTRCGNSRRSLDDWRYGCAARRPSYS